MDEQNIIKKSIRIGGPTLAAIIVNRLLGNTSVKSNLIAGAIGAGTGLTVDALSNPDLDMSRTVDNTEKAVSDVENLVKEAGWASSWLTSPITTLRDIWQGGSVPAEKRDKALERLEDLRKSKNIKRATPSQKKRVEDLYKRLRKDKALDERQLDAAMTLGGSFAGAGVATPFAFKAQQAINKYTRDIKYKDLINDVINGSPDVLNNARKETLAKAKNAQNAKARLLETLSFKKGAKRAGFKQTISDLGSVLTFKGQREKAKYNILEDLTKEQIHTRQGLAAKLKDAEDILDARRSGYVDNLHEARKAFKAGKAQWAQDTANAKNKLAALQSQVQKLISSRDQLVTAKGKIRNQNDYNKLTEMIDAKNTEISKAHDEINKLPKNVSDLKEYKAVKKAIENVRKSRKPIGGLLDKEYKAVNEASRALNTPKVSARQSKQAIDNLLKAKMSPSKLRQIAIKSFKSPVGKPFAAMLALGALGGSLVASGLSNYPGSKEEVTKYN